jgi:hypothetical protein
MAFGVDEILSDEEPEEIVVGRHVSGIILEEGLNTNTGRAYCSNCRRNIHCRVQIDKDTNEATIKMTCKNKECECKCKTHFACKRCGYLHPYGTTCSRVDAERQFDPKAEKAFQKLMDKWKKHEAKQTNKVVNKK